VKLPRQFRLLALLLTIAGIGALRPVWGPAYDEYFNYRFNSQYRHLRWIDRHIAEIEPAWRKFRSHHTGYDNVYLFGYTGFEGMFAAGGTVPSQEHVIRLEKFMKNSRPPRPVFISMVGVQVSESASAATPVERKSDATVKP
jgi:hypothetical protein